MERRSWPRQSVDIAGVFATAELQSQPCRLRDFCAGGVLFEPTTEVVELLSVGDRISVSFNPTVATSAPQVELQGEVKRIAGKLIGLQFESTLEYALLRQLKAVAKRYRESLSTGAAAATAGSRRDAVVTTLISAFDAWWPALYQQLMPQLDSSLLAAAGAAQSDRETGACFQSINILSAEGAEFSQCLRSAFLCQASAPAPLYLQPGVAGKKMASVDKGAFEDWLLVSSAAARIESEHREMLSRVSNGLCEAYGLCVGAENYPASPSVLIQLFKRAFSASFTSTRVRAILFDEFERIASARLIDFLHPLLDAFEHAGLAPSATQHGKLPLQEQEQEPALGKFQAAVGGSDAQAVGGSEAELEVTGLGDQDDVSVEGAEDPNAHNKPGHLRQLQPFEQSVAGLSPISLAQLRADLDAAAADPDQGLPVGSTLSGWISGRLNSGYPEARGLTPEQRLPVELTDSIFEHVLKHKHLSPALRPAMQKLRLPLLNTMLKDPSVLADRKHPARQLVNQVASLGCGGGPGSGGLQQTIDNYVEQILANRDCKVATFESILRQVNALVELQNQAFLRNLLAVQVACHGQEQLAVAHRELGNELLTLTGGHRVASVFKHLLDFGWRKLLVLVLLKQGRDSDAWKSYTAVLGQLLGLLRLRKRGTNVPDSRDYLKRVQLVIEVLKNGISEAGAATFAGYRGVDELYRLLMNQLDAVTLAALLQLDHLEPAAPAFDESAKNRYETDRTAAIRRKIWLHQVQEMEIGADLLLAPGAPSEQRLILAWRAEDLSSFVFVDERGKESHTFLLSDMVSQLISRRMAFIPRQEMPVFDQGVLEMIQGVYRAANISDLDQAPVSAESGSAIATGVSLVEWSARVAALLENDAFSLRIQKIAALGLGDDHPYHEVLLAVVIDGESQSAPAELIQAAQASGLMPSIDQWVVRASLRWMTDNPGSLAKIGGLAVKVSGSSLNDEGFLHFVFEEIVASGVDTSRLCFQITEASAIDNLAFTGGFIQEVRQLGCSFALDDVGAGMSPYAYCKALSVDYLKIDGSFIRDIAGSPAGSTMVRSISDIGHLLGMNTIAAFVDNDNIASTLFEFSIDCAEGNSLDRPYYLSSVWA